jgi:aminopeptidase N
VCRIRRRRCEGCTPVRSRALAVALVCAGSALQVQRLSAQAAAPVERAAPPRLTVGILSYRFSIRLPVSGDSIEGTAEIGVRRAHAGAVDTLPLDLVGMVPDAVSDATRERPLSFTYDGSVLRVTLAAAARPGPETVRVRYHGRPTDGLITGANARRQRSFFADDWPDRARHFIPTVDHPAYKAPVTWEIDAPGTLGVVANGRLAGVTDLPDARRRWRYVETRPIPTYTMVFGATVFSVSRHRPSIVGRDTTANEVWSYPEDSAFADAGPFRRASEIVDALSRLIGPFPYRKLAHVESSTRYGGMENASAIFYDQGGYVSRRMGEGVVRHETAHQWFGDAVTERDWRHLWLSEGFASYFDLVIGAALDGDSVLRVGMRASAEGYFGSRDVDRPLVDSAAQDLMGLLNANSYNKGAWLLHMLRGEVGDSAFFGGIREYYRSFRDSSVSSEDFQRVMERSAGRDLGWFFRQWLYQPGYPRLQADLHVDSAARTATVRVRQAQPAAWGRFRLPRLDVRFLSAGEAVGDVTCALDPALAEQTFTFTLRRMPTEVRLDPDGHLLMRATVP